MFPYHFMTRTFCHIRKASSSRRRMARSLDAFKTVSLSTPHRCTTRCNTSPVVVRTMAMPPGLLESILPPLRSGKTPFSMLFCSLYDKYRGGGRNMIFICRVVVVVALLSSKGRSGLNSFTVMGVDSPLFVGLSVASCMAHWFKKKTRLDRAVSVSLAAKSCCKNCLCGSTSSLVVVVVGKSMSSIVSKTNFMARCFVEDRAFGKGDGRNASPSPSSIHHGKANQGNFISL